MNADLPDPAYALHGVVAQDASEALFAFVCLATSFAEAPGRIGIPGLDPTRRYRVGVVFPTGNGAYLHRTPPAWLARGAQASGRYLAEVGLPMPILAPEHAILLRVTAL